MCQNKFSQGLVYNCSKKGGRQIYKEFVASFIADLLGFKGFNLGFTSKVQKITRARAMVQ
jgi:hypothetical protein